MRGSLPYMQIRIESENAKSIRIIKRERLKVHRKKDSAAEISNELIRKALLMIKLPVK
jgi:hypothetical protein